MMRNWIDLFEARLVAPENPQHGAGEPLTPETAPAVFYHGTNILAALSIIADGEIEAEEQGDDEEYDPGAVVCVTADRKMGRMFAIEFERFNSSEDVGVVFQINGKALASTTQIVPYHAESAGVYEFEYRVEGNIPMSLVTKATIVGKGAKLKSGRYLEHLWDAAKERRMSNLMPYQRFIKVLQELITLARPTNP